MYLVVTHKLISINGSREEIDPATIAKALQGGFGASTRVCMNEAERDAFVAERAEAGFFCHVMKYEGTFKTTTILQPIKVA